MHHSIRKRRSNSYKGSCEQVITVEDVLLDEVVGIYNSPRACFSL